MDTRILPSLDSILVILQMKFVETGIYDKEASPVLKLNLSTRKSIQIRHT